MRTAAAFALMASLAASAPARAAISRPVIFLDGDAAIRTLDSEDVLLTQSKPGTTTTEFGSAVALGRVNGDALADAVVGQRTQNKVFVYLGSAAARSAPWFDDPNMADIVITAPSNTSDKIQQFGFSVAVADLDGDGVGDLLVGAPFSDPGGKTDAGLAYAILGVGSLATGAQVSLAAPPPGVTVVKMTRGTPGKAGDLLGFAVGAGRLAGPPADTIFVVTARDADAVAPVRADAGAAHVARGSVLPSGGGIFDLTTGSAVTFFGSDAADALGESVALCDVDGAGDADLLVGAIFGDGLANAGVNRGEALLFLGENIVSGFHAGATSGASADMTIAGASDGDDLGYTVGCGDVNGDGRADLLVGAIFADSIGEARPSAGEAYVLRGRASQPDPMTPGRRELIDPMTSAPQTPVDLSVATDPNDSAPDGADLALFGATTADELGFSLGAGDLDGDGIKDLVVGARRYDRDASRVNVGATYVLRGSAGFLDPGATGLSRGIDLHAGTSRAFEAPLAPVDHLPNRVDGIVIGATHDDHSSWAVATGDLNGDLGDELMISAIGDLNRVPGFRGEAYILSFADIDGDGASDLLDNDNDNDGIPNDDEVDGIRTGFVTDPSKPDTDGDGIQDGTEEGFTCPGGGGVFIAACDDPNVAFTSTDPNLPFFFKPDRQPTRVTSPVEGDTDDDGLADGAEDANANGRLDSAESDPSLFDTDGDLIFDGTERGVTSPLADTDLSKAHYRADADAGASKTNPTLADTDGDGVPDGVEDALRDGEVAGDLDHDHVLDGTEVWTESDPTKSDSDGDGLPDGMEDRNHNGLRDAGESSPVDADTDDDGLPDGWIDGANGEDLDGQRQPLEGEDRDGDGVFGTIDAESSPLLADSDGDGLPDGTEVGLPAGGGVPGPNGTPDAGPGGDGTDITSPAFRPDAAPNEPATDPWDADTDNDGLPDGFIDGFPSSSRSLPNGIASIYEGEDLNLNGRLDAGETSPVTSDTDGDGVRDGVELGVKSPGVIGMDMVPDPVSGGVQDGTGGAGLLLDTDDSTVTDPLDADSDDDGLSEAGEDANGNGKVDAGETDPNDFDSDDDQLPDGLERGVVTPVSGAAGTTGTDLSAMHFIADLDPNTMTNAGLADTDGGGATDGDEDASHDGRVDMGERNPLVRGDDDRTGVLEFTDTLNGTTTTTPVTPGGTLFLRLDDDTAKNVSPTVLETVPATCTSDVPDMETFTLIAVDPNSGVFAGSLPTNATDPNIPGELTVATGSLILCVYTDPQDPADVRTVTQTAAVTAPPVIPQFDVSLPGGPAVDWTAAGPTSLQPGAVSWNLYRGTITSLRATGVYTQVALGCGLATPHATDAAAPAPGGVFFYLAAGVSGGVEGSLGTDSAGRRRPSTAPCGP